MNEGKEFIKIVDLENEFEAGLISTELDKKNIPYSVRSHYEEAFDGVFQFQYGWGYLAAPAEYEDQIMTIYEDLREEIKERTRNNKEKGSVNQEDGE